MDRMWCTRRRIFLDGFKYYFLSSRIVLNNHSYVTHSLSFLKSEIPLVKMSSRKDTSKAPVAHPSYAVMIAEAIAALKDRAGSSRQAILKYVCENYKVDPAKAGQYLRVALKAGIKKGSLKMAKESGKGAGKFKLVKVEKPKKKAAPKNKAAAKMPPSASAKPSSKKLVAKTAAKKKSAINGNSRIWLPKNMSASQKAAAMKKAWPSMTKKVKKPAAKKAKLPSGAKPSKKLVAIVAKK